MMFHGLTSERIVATGNGQQNRQRRFYCEIHGWIDLFVFPNAADRHAKCCDTTKDAGTAVQPPCGMERAA